MSHVASTTRYLCPLECGWHHDVPPPPVPSDITVPIAPEAVQRMAADVSQRTEIALREHLDTHTTEQFVRTIQGLRAEVATLKRAAQPAPW